MRRTLISVLLSGFACGTATPFERGEQRGTSDAGSGDGGAGAVVDASVIADAGADAGTTPLGFATSVAPILQSGCASCHATFGGSYRITGIMATDYQNVLLFVNTGSASLSFIVRKPTGQESHGGGSQFQTDSTEYSTLLQWITDGARP